MVTNNQIKNKMIGDWINHLDNSDCLNTTSLAESTANFFNENPEDGSPIDEKYFDIAAQLDSELVKLNLVNN